MKALLPDAYTMRARWTPAVLAGAPAFAFVFAIIALGTFSAAKLIASAGMLAMFIALSDFARRRGRAIEPAVMEATGGNPTTTMQRHRAGIFDRGSLLRIHAFLADALGTASPTVEEEQSDPVAADQYYARGAAWLRENTRDKKKFNLIAEENMTYGFRRNLLGLKNFALAINFIVLLLAVIALIITKPIGIESRFHQGLFVVIFVSVLHAAFFIINVTMTSVCDASKLYSRQLLLATESPHLRKSTAKRAARSAKA